jgi:hypothetical protein
MLHSGYQYSRIPLGLARGFRSDQVGTLMIILKWVSRIKVSCKLKDSQQGEKSGEADSEIC